MATNRLPDPLDRLFALAEDMADGLHAHEAPVGIKQNTEAAVRADLAAARAGTLFTAHSDARSAVHEAENAAGAAVAQL
jgi:hypothetical protein